MSEDARTQFQKDTENFGIEILLDTGVYRHLRISNKDPNQLWNQWYTITTWDEELCISGDMGTLVFRRLPDMFKFFRGQRINPDYWAGKIQRVGSSIDNPIEEFCFKSFSEDVKDSYDQFVEDLDIDFVKEQAKTSWEDFDTIEGYKEALWDEIKDQVLDYAEFEGVISLEHTTVFMGLVG